MRDELDDLIRESCATDPLFKSLFEAAGRRRQLVQSLGALREAMGVRRADLARQMATSSAALDRLERGESSPDLLTLDYYAALLGKRIEWRLVDDPAAASPPAGQGAEPRAGRRRSPAKAPEQASAD